MRHSDKRRTRVIVIRVDPDEYEAIEQTAGRHGLTMAEFLRTLGTCEAFCEQIAQMIQHDWITEATRLESEHANHRERAKLIKAAFDAITYGKRAIEQVERVVTAAAAKLFSVIDEVSPGPRAGTRQ